MDLRQVFDAWPGPVEPEPREAQLCLSHREEI